MYKRQAYYLVYNLPLSSNKERYVELVQKEEWKEVFIFAGGIFKNQQEQDEFLDFVMEHNLPLYVECVNAKSDVSKADDGNILNRMLTQILKTYRFILNRYFPVSYTHLVVRSKILAESVYGRRQRLACYVPKSGGERQIRHFSSALF